MLSHTTKMRKFLLSRTSFFTFCVNFCCKEINLVMLDGKSLELDQWMVVGADLSNTKQRVSKIPVLLGILRIQVLEAASSAARRLFGSEIVAQFKSHSFSKGLQHALHLFLKRADRLKRACARLDFANVVQRLQSHRRTLHPQHVACFEGHLGHQKTTIHTPLDLKLGSVEKSTLILLVTIHDQNVTLVLFFFFFGKFQTFSLYFNFNERERVVVGVDCKKNRS